eukprot:GSChrysophyteH1.ASY1.ANO1.339.1 assembled CDS
MMNRNLEKSAPLLEQIQKDCGAPERVHLIRLDLSDLASCRTAAEEFKSLNLPLHILLNNGGVMAIQERTLSKDGFEMQMGTNHFGHFCLTMQLLDCLKAAGKSRVVNVSSHAHFRNFVQFDDMEFNEVQYNDWKAYGQSKTANILFTKELQRLHSADGITSVCLHPGVIESELWRHAGKVFQFNKTIPQGASTSMYCCVAEDVIGGEYYNDCEPMQAAPYATDMDAAAKLWAVSLERTAKL